MEEIFSRGQRSRDVRGEVWVNRLVRLMHSRSSLLNRVCGGGGQRIRDPLQRQNKEGEGENRAEVSRRKKKKVLKI